MVMVIKRDNNTDADDDYNNNKYDGIQQQVAREWLGGGPQRVAIMEDLYPAIILRHQETETEAARLHEA